MELTNPPQAYPTQLPDHLAVYCVPLYAENLARRRTCVRTPSTLQAPEQCKMLQDCLYAIERNSSMYSFSLIHGLADSMRHLATGCFKKIPGFKIRTLYSMYDLL